MKEYTLARTGKVPVRFEGELFAESDGCRCGTRDQTRWHRVEVYRTAAGRWVAGVEFLTRWDGEQGRQTVYVCDTPAALAAALTAHPMPEAIGYPEGEAYQEKQRRLLADLQSRYDSQVTEVLGDEFAEEI